MDIDRQAIGDIERKLDPEMLARIHAAADHIVATKQRGGKIAVITGSGPNVHEGVTTLIAELITAGVIDGVTTSSAVISHEMGGTLDKVKRCQGSAVGVAREFLPRGGEFELTLMDQRDLDEIRRFLPIDDDLLERLNKAEGATIIKAAGNLGYPMGLWMEVLAREIMGLARAHGASFEDIAGLGADPRTMLGAAAAKDVPILVTIPQLIGGGMVGIAIGDSISLTERATRLAQMLDQSDVIIESGVALTQEIHDGPFEMYTGHGLWSAWQGHFTYSLEGKKLYRIDLDPALNEACRIEKEGGAVQAAIAKGQPKTKLFKIPFRMEMSGFARHEGSTAIIGDLGEVWPILASRIAEGLGIRMNFMSYPQQTPRGQEMREWLVREVRPLSRAKMLANLKARLANRVEAPVTAK